MADAVMGRSPVLVGSIQDSPSLGPGDDQWLKALFSFSGTRSEDHDSLKMMAQAMALLGNPHLQLRVIHITGTSGKTSTSYYIRDLLQACGFRTGMTISPHINSLTERVQVDATPVEASQFDSYLNQILVRLAPLRGQLTYFELVICLALSVFADQQVDYAIVEVGIGGEHDATNILSGSNKLAVITSVGLDHTEKLGRTLAKIARAKAGIIVPGGVTIVPQQPDEVWDVLVRHTHSIDASLKMVNCGPAVDSDVLVPFQVRNWSLARAVVTYLSSRDHFKMPSEDKLNQVLQRVMIPARYEWFQLGNHRILLDGAHNPQEITSLVEAMTNQGIGPVPTLATLSSAPSTKIVESISALKPVVSHLIVPSFQIGHDQKSKASAPAPLVAKIATDLGISTTVVPDLNTAWQQLLTDPTPYLLVTGSLYLVSLVRSHLLI